MEQEQESNNIRVIIPNTETSSRVCKKRLEEMVVVAVVAEDE